ncbi:MAG: hypothetical protein BWY36_00166 [Candidatus Diapherotrites archaeon ADurb.Bin253]|nr:MAG: hypothetical protein BWY36_00166 [Candidatus Diapherotrites archaeon ADurb.Bin253]
MKHSKIKSYRFEISLIIIAIFIPLFLESIPIFADRLTEIFVLPLNFNIIRIVSLFLGLIWLLVLLIGIYEFNVEDKICFHKIFDVSCWATIVACLILLFLYSIYLIIFFIGYKRVIYFIAFILGIVVVFKGAKEYGKEKK